MSWSNGSASRAALRSGLVVLALGAILILAACSGFRPVYGPTGVVNQRLAFSYADPGSRLEQIVVQELMLRLGKGGGPDAPQIRISVASGSRDLTRTDVDRPRTQKEMAVTATYSVVAADGEVLMTGRRKATAQYETVGQVLADESAAEDARERAARAVADTIRLSILAGLAAPVRETLVIQ
jgi:hypothetical protein